MPPSRVSVSKECAGLGGVIDILAGTTTPWPWGLRPHRCDRRPNSLASGSPLCDDLAAAGALLRPAAVLGLHLDLHDAAEA